jgi:hypothetical protein
MLYYMATDSKTNELQPKIIKFLKRIIPKGTKLKIVVNPTHIIESKLPKFVDSDILLWHPKVAGENLELVREWSSFVILLNRTIYIQKISPRNPINENLAVNNNFRLLFIDEEFSDITNQDWKLAVQEDDYRITHEQFLTLLAKQQI